MWASFEHDEPACFHEALSSPNEWMPVMRDEMNSVDKIQVWELVDLPFGVNLLEINEL